MKRTCSGCRAFSIDQCELLYKVGNRGNWPRTRYYPLEPCPKPKTYKAWMEEIKKRDDKGGDPMTLDKARDTVLKAFQTASESLSDDNYIELLEAIVEDLEDRRTVKLLEMEDSDE